MYVCCYVSSLILDSLIDVHITNDISSSVLHIESGFFVADCIEISLC
jgi:hypothetical protein